MRGHRGDQPAIFYQLHYSRVIPLNHPIRRIKALAEEQLEAIRPLISGAYSRTGRPSVPPETLILSLLLQALYGRTERGFCEELGWNLMYKWFVGLQPDDPVFNHSTFSKNRDRMEQHGLIRAFFDSTVMSMIESEAASIENCSVDGTMIQSLASRKSMMRKDDDTPYDSRKRNDRRGERQKNDTHQSRTDPDALLRSRNRGDKAVLAHSLHLTTDNESGAIMAVEVEAADGKCEARAGLSMVDHLQGIGLSPFSLAADRGYDWGWFLVDLEKRGVTPCVAPKRKKPPVKVNPDQNARRRNLARSDSAWHREQQHKRWKIEGPFGWLKQVARLARTRYWERWKTKQSAIMGCAAYNMLCLVNRRPA